MFERTNVAASSNERVKYAKQGISDRKNDSGDLDRHHLPDG
jgi:hypothetical protein